jgi:hypothetical protein
LCKASALPDWHLMAVLVQHMEGQRDLVTYKSVVHLSDQAIKNVCKCFIFGFFFFLRNTISKVLYDYLATGMKCSENHYLI